MTALVTGTLQYISEYKCTSTAYAFLFKILWTNSLISDIFLKIIEKEFSYLLNKISVMPDFSIIGIWLIM